MRETWQFWVLAILVATSQGGIQALSRSMFGKMLPDKNRSGEYFGFFDIFGKFSSVMGPALMGFVTQIATVVLLGRQSLTPETAPRPCWPPRSRRHRRGAYCQFCSSSWWARCFTSACCPHAEKRGRGEVKNPYCPCAGGAGPRPKTPTRKVLIDMPEAYTYPHRPRGAGTKQGSMRQYGGL